MIHVPPSHLVFSLVCPLPELWVGFCGACVLILDIVGVVLVISPDFFKLRNGG